MGTRDDRLWRDVVRLCLVMLPWILFAVAAVALAVAHRNDGDCNPMEAHHCMQANDRVIACAMRIHTLEQEVDMLRLRIEELEEDRWKKTQGPEE